MWHVKHIPYPYIVRLKMSRIFHIISRKIELYSFRFSRYPEWECHMVLNSVSLRDISWFIYLFIFIYYIVCLNWKQLCFHVVERLPILVKKSLHESFRHNIFPKEAGVLISVYKHKFVIIMECKKVYLLNRRWKSIIL